MNITPYQLKSLCNVGPIRSSRKGSDCIGSEIALKPFDGRIVTLSRACCRLRHLLVLFACEDVSAVAFSNYMLIFIVKLRKNKTRVLSQPGIAHNTGIRRANYDLNKSASSV
jgi:hypothetical protein